MPNLNSSMGNFRLGIDDLKDANMQTEESLSKRTAVQMAMTQRYQDNTDRAFDNIAKGMNGISDAINQSEELKLKRDLQRQTMEKNKMEMDQATVMNPLKVTEAKQNIAENDRRAKAENLAFTKGQYEFDRTKDVNESSDLALSQSYKGKKPGDWNYMTTQEQAAYVASSQRFQAQELDKSAKVAQIKESNAKSDEIEVKTKSEIADMVGKLPGTMVQNLTRDPESAASLGLDMKSPQMEDRGKKFTEIQNKADGVNKSQRSMNRIAALGGAKADPVTGEVSQQDLDKWVQSVGGWHGLMSTIEGKPNATEIKGEVAKMISDAAQSGHFPLRGEWEQDLARETKGIGPGMPGYTPDSYLGAFESVLQSKGSAAGFFANMQNQIKTDRTDIANSFTANDGFHGMPVSQRSATMYNLLPQGMKMEGTKDYLRADEFAKLPPQQQANLVYGVNPQTKEPNFAVDDKWTGAAQLVQDLKDPKKASEMVANANNVNFHWDNQTNATAFNTMKEARSKSVLLFTAPSAIAGVDATKGPVGVGATGEQVNVKTGNPNTPIVPRETVGATGGWEAVKQPSGKAAAGATPINNKDYEMGTASKFKLQPSWKKDVQSLFNPTGGQSDEQDEGSIATPAYGAQ